jgi:heme oxygenase
VTSAPAAGSSPAVAPLSQRLREGTREVHDRIENGASFNRLIVVRIPPADDSIDGARRASAIDEYREIYRRFLIASYGFEVAVRTRLDASPAHTAALAAGYEFEPDDPVACIEDDLAGMGVHDPAPFGIMTGLPEAKTLGEWVGIDYVRRGSRAGGAVISAAVAHNLGLSKEAGAGFLFMYGKDTKRALMAMREWIDSLPLTGADADRAVATAVATFEAAGRWHQKLEQAF